MVDRLGQAGLHCGLRTEDFYLGMVGRCRWWVVGSWLWLVNHWGRFVVGRNMGLGVVDGLEVRDLLDHLQDNMKL